MLVILERGGVLTSPCRDVQGRASGIMDNLLRRELFAKGDFVPGPDAPTMGFLSDPFGEGTRRSFA